MKRYVREVAMPLLLISILAVGTLYGASDIRAEDKGLAQQIQGTWTLVSIYNELDGKRTDQFGSNPRGSLILTSNGRFSMIIMKASLPKFAANSRVKGTAEENQAVVQGSFAFFGTYTIASEKDNMVNLRVEGSTFPNWDGEEQKRVMTVVGDEMKLVNPTATIGGTNHHVWKRVK